VVKSSFADLNGFGTGTALDPEAKMVREWRHSLQRTFLGGKAHPKDEVRHFASASHVQFTESAQSQDMPAVDLLFTQIEQFEKMTIGHLQVCLAILVLLLFAYCVYLS
jgi:hypothetical protein